MPGKRYSTEQMVAKLWEAERLHGQARGLRCITRSLDMLSPLGRGSDRSGELGERRRDPQFGTDVDAEFVVAAAQVLQEGVPAITTCAVRSVCSPRIGLSRRLS
jgi:hypothetical protein